MRKLKRPKQNVQQRSGKIMNKLELTNEELDLLKFIVQDFEYNDNKERDLINQIEAKIYDLKDLEFLRTINFLKG